ncbi:ParB N-terminal domain-containing protein [Limimaricola sp. G21655-S1]|uniref:ParB/RepB/Spo0J family partition protein n=1 Tax=Limimaricola sp. G21655-S1 TaxID=3014768 RepID=UPI0022AEAAFB|nr:ParB N-terminal domain-containing protein [Limimaricola sp. G21655-S1]MCZ4262910.1 ParB N-terminal domain-containing protein [Limimaricola sp. G21655-S1]
MAKRKRLSPPRLDIAPEAAPETKSAFPSYPLGVAPTRNMPIASVAREAAGSAALDEMGRTLSEAREEGRLIQWLPLEEIDESYLVRDRIETCEEEMQALIDSLRDRGQQTAIEVTDLGEGTKPRWGLISGWRRLTALRRIATEEGTPGRVLAIPRSPRNAAEAYRAMVEENEIRVGLSHYERARIVARAADAGVYADDTEALRALFGAATRSRRSKIGSFVRIVRALDAALRFPTQIGERAGLALVRALDDDPELAERLRARLAAAPADAEAEAALLTEAIAETIAKTEVPAPVDTPAPAPARRSVPRAASVELRPGLSCRETSAGLLLSGELLKQDGMRDRILALLREGISL